MTAEDNSCDTSDNDSGCCSVKNDESVNFSKHWRGVYAGSDISKLGWYEDESTPVLELIDACNLEKQAKILTVGAGATTLIDSLVQLGYGHLMANDISSYALEALKRRLGDAQEKITWIVDDITNPDILNEVTDVKLWIDRAVLHFFVAEKDQETYFKLLKNSVAKGGYVLLAEFNLNGATKCSGLPVKRYDAALLASKLGSDFVLQKAFDYIYTMPNGDKRNYVYTLFKRIF